MRLFLACVCVLSLVACSSNEPEASVSPSAAPPASVVVANYEIVNGQSTRFLAGLLLDDGRVVTGGSVQMRFAPLNSDGSAGEASESVTGTYLTPSTTEGSPAGNAQASTPEEPPGVYEVEGATFSQAGDWIVEVASDVEGVGVVRGSTTFEVVAEAMVPAPGERAPRSDNPVIGDAGVPAIEIDSRALDGKAIPDPRLHRGSIADAVQSGRPAVIIFSTPTYCQSRFCGPVTDTIDGLAKEYGDDVDFIHVEVWKDFERSIANPTANEWLLESDELNEPWLFIVDDDGRIQARWDNLVIRDEVEDAIREL